jgi:hypothetical protein
MDKLHDPTDFSPISPMKPCVELPREVTALFVEDGRLFAQCLGPLTFEIFSNGEFEPVVDPDGLVN